MSGWKDFLRDVANDDGFIPITGREQTRLLAELIHAQREGGTAGINKYVLNRYQEKGDQLVDIPGVSWDDDYSVADLGDDVVEVTDQVASLFQDIVTEVLGFLGATLASVINQFVDPSIDDMALPASTLSDCTAVFLPSLRENAAFGSHKLIDAPGLFVGLPPSVSEFTDSKGVFEGVDRAELVLRDSSRSGSSIFLWKFPNATGTWA